MVDSKHVAWCRRHFDMLVDGGMWGIPRSGLIFQRRGETLVLTATMPHMAGMPISPRELCEQQARELADVRENFGAAGITVTDGTK